MSTAATIKDFKTRRQIGFGLVEYPESGSFYKLGENGELLQVAMNADGSPDMTDEGDFNDGAVEWSAIDEQSAAECRQIQAELQSNDVQGEAFWNGVKLPDFVIELLNKKKIVPFFRAGENIAGFTMTTHNGTELQFFVQPGDEDARTYEYLERFSFVNPATDPDGDTPTEYADEEKARKHAESAIYGEDFAGQVEKIDKDRNHFNDIQDAATHAILVTEDEYYEALEVLPPIYGKKCFAMGETQCYSSDNTPIYYWFSQINGFYWGFIGTQPEAETIFEKMRKAQAKD